MLGRWRGSASFRCSLLVWALLERQRLDAQMPRGPAPYSLFKPETGRFHFLPLAPGFFLDLFLSRLIIAIISYA